MKFLCRRVCLFLFVFLTLSGCANDQEKKTAHLNKGNQFFQSREYKKAEIEYKNALQIDNTYSDALLKLGETQLKLGNPKERSRFTAVRNSLFRKIPMPLSTWQGCIFWGKISRRRKNGSTKFFRTTRETSKPFS